MGKISYLGKRAKEFGETHIKAQIPSSKYALRDLIHMEKGYISMEKSMGGGTELIAREYLDGESVMDVGCGSACHARYFMGYGLNYSGMDLSETAIALALLKYPTKTFYNISIYETPELLQPRLFDNVYCCSLFEHIGNWERALSNMLMLAKRKVAIGFFDGLSLLQKNYYEFHPFTDKDLVDFKVIPDYGYKPVVTPQESNIEAYVFQQPGNYRVNFGIASMLCGAPLDEMGADFDFDLITNTVSMRLSLQYAQNNNLRFERLLPMLPGFIEKRKVARDEIGYFMNRFSREEFLAYLQEKKLKYEVVDYEKNNGTLATFVIIEK